MQPGQIRLRCAEAKTSLILLQKLQCTDVDSVTEATILCSHKQSCLLAAVVDTDRVVATDEVFETLLVQIAEQDNAASSLQVA